MPKMKKSISLISCMYTNEIENITTQIIAQGLTDLSAIIRVCCKITVKATLAKAFKKLWHVKTIKRPPTDDADSKAL